MFLKSSHKFGFAYKYQKTILNHLFFYFKPNFLYRKIFFDKISYFTSRKYLQKTESLCQKYLNLFNFFDLKLTINIIIPLKIIIIHKVNLKNKKITN